MATLNDFINVQSILKRAAKNKIDVLHKFVFKEDGDRYNRKRLRSFEGFDYGRDEEEFNKLTEYVAENLSAEDLITICNLLDLDYDVDDVFLHIFKNLTKGNLLYASKYKNDDEDDEISEDEDFIDDANKMKKDGLRMGSDDEQRSNDGGSASANDEIKRRKNDGKGVRSDEYSKDGNNYNNDEKKNNEEIARKNENKIKTTVKSNFENITRVNMSNFGNESRNMNEFEDGVRRMKINEYSGVNALSQCPMFTLNFNDIENSIRKFDGTSNLRIEKWIKEFEDVAELMNWNDFQKLIFGKKSLEGLAKTFIDSENRILTWSALKESLINEFKTHLSSAQLHKILSERKMQDSESIKEYFIEMKNLASCGDIDENALIFYIIQGINDVNVNKSLLYGAANLKEFRDKLKIYEEFRSMINSNEKKKTTEKTDDNLVCFNCGKKGHIASKCENRSKGPKCFRCNEYGHISKSCPNTRINTMVLRANNSMMNKEIKIREYPLISLFDTGSKFNLIVEKIYEKLEKPRLTKSNIYLEGFAPVNSKNRIKPIGSFSTNVTIDGEVFEINFHVIPDNCIDYDAVLGEEFCQQAEIKITPNKISFSKLNIDNQAEVKDERSNNNKFKNNDELQTDEFQNDDNSNDVIAVMNIDVVSDEIDPDIDYEASKVAKTLVKDLIKNYKPEKIKTNIVLRDDIQLKQLLEEKIIRNFNDERDELRRNAKIQILMVQEENKRTFNRKRKPAAKYRVGDKVAIKRTQLGGGLKLKAKYLGPYEIVKVKSNDTYDVIKVSSNEGPIRTSTCAEYIKAWCSFTDTDDDDAFGSNA